MTAESIVKEFVSMISTWDVLLMFLVWLGLHTFEERFPEPFVKPRVGWRLMPFAPVLICIPCMFVPGPWMPDTVTWPMRIMFGALLGVGAYNFGGIANRFGLGKLLNNMGINLFVAKTGGTPRSKRDAHGEPEPKELPAAGGETTPTAAPK